MVHGCHAVSTPQPFKLAVADMSYDSVIATQFDVAVVPLDCSRLAIKGLSAVDGSQFDFNVCVHDVRSLSIFGVVWCAVSFNCIHCITEKIPCQVANQTLLSLGAAVRLLYINVWLSGVLCCVLTACVSLVVCLVVCAISWLWRHSVRFYDVFKYAEKLRCYQQKYLIFKNHENLQVRKNI